MGVILDSVPHPPRPIGLASWHWNVWILQKSRRSPPPWDSSSLPLKTKTELWPSLASFLRSCRALRFALYRPLRRPNRRRTWAGLRLRQITWPANPEPSSPSISARGEFPLFPSCNPCFCFIKSCTKSPKPLAPANCRPWRRRRACRRCPCSSPNVFHRWIKI